VIDQWNRTPDDSIHWRIEIPRTFRSTSKRLLRGKLKFQIRNNTESTLLLRILVRSLSQSFIFPTATRQVIRKTPVRYIKSTYQTSVEKSINPKQELEISFQALFRPHLIFSKNSTIRLQYDISALGEHGEFVTGSQSRILTFPLTKK
jgi:hypothetical protein